MLVSSANDFSQPRDPYYCRENSDLPRNVTSFVWNMLDAVTPADGLSCCSTQTRTLVSVTLVYLSFVFNQDVVVIHVLCYGTL